ncbi:MULTISPECIES: branched-chain amino acid ABC transporter permease [Pandoraea]|uniref:ABC transporter permease n=1 Tax=Pandoraea bronchicola TaxID=2508287 RepID=A0A5E5BZQ7_9BURK|nr:branched-chain amino acid ABC transporter permease [Pandoraea bronchicola]VVE89843.1 ABC transporter permease [Pandoraea bronchicola]
MDQFALTLINGLSWGMTVFLTAAGLSLVFGILHVLNFSHGGFLMIGAYLSYAIGARLQADSLWSFLGTAVVCAAAVGVLGAVVERVVFRRLRAVSEAYSLIATYALLILCQGVVKLIWGIDFLSVPPPEALGGALSLGDVIVPTFVVCVIVCGVVVFLAMDVILHRTGIGKRVQSVAVDPWMASLLGINVQAVFAWTVVCGFALAGLAGGLLSINQSLSPAMGSALIIQAFGALIVGGLGNIRGAFIASVLLGLVTSFGDRFVPDVPGLFFFVSLAAILLIRPQGLMRGLR